MSTLVSLNTSSCVNFCGQQFPIIHFPDLNSGCNLLCDQREHAFAGEFETANRLGWEWGTTVEQALRYVPKNERTQEKICSAIQGVETFQRMSNRHTINCCERFTSLIKWAISGAVISITAHLTADVYKKKLELAVPAGRRLGAGA